MLKGKPHLSENVEKLRSVFSRALNVPEVRDELKYQEIPEWDSVGHMALVASIDEEFGIMMDTDDVIAMSSFQEAQKILKKYGVEF
jgi:acyl carrier protein